MDTKDIEQRNEQYSKGKGISMVFSAMVYVGVVIAATVVFISFVLSAFPPNAYLSRLIMTFAGFLVGCSMIAFPLALHLWAVDRIHRAVTIALYFVEMVFVGVNTIVGFAHLLSKYAETAAPEWAVLYEPFSIGAILYTLAAWGVVWLLDPEHKRKAKDLAIQERFKSKISERLDQFLDTAEGEDVIMEIAEQQAKEQFSPAAFKKGQRTWGTGRRNKTEPLPQNTPPAPSAMDIQEIVRQLRVLHPEIPQETAEELVRLSPMLSKNGKIPNPTNHQ